MLALYEFDAAPRLAWLGWMAVTVVWQFFASIYLGVFLIGDDADGGGRFGDHRAP
jgi:hypothetical protein